MVGAYHHVRVFRVRVFAVLARAKQFLPQLRSSPRASLRRSPSLQASSQRLPLRSRLRPSRPSPQKHESLTWLQSPRGRLSHSSLNRDRYSRPKRRVYRQNPCQALLFATERKHVSPNGLTNTHYCTILAILLAITTPKSRVQRTGTRYSPTDPSSRYCARNFSSSLASCSAVGIDPSSATSGDFVF